MYGDLTPLVILKKIGGKLYNQCFTSLCSRESTIREIKMYKKHHPDLKLNYRIRKRIEKSRYGNGFYEAWDLYVSCDKDGYWI